MSFDIKMARKMFINRLEKEELEWELRFRGLNVGTAEEMRSQLSMALRMEKAGDSFKYPSYPFKFADDEAALSRKCVELDALLSSYSGSNNVSETQKLQSKLSHTWNRFDQMDTAGDVTLEGKRTEILTKLISLHDEFQTKSRPPPSKDAIVPAALSVVTSNLDGQFLNGVQNAATSSPVVSIPHASSQANISQTNISQANMSHSLNSKMVPPHKWGLEKFSGSSRSLSITAFLERVEELRIARHVPSEILLDSGVDLFSDKAYQFYKDVRLRAHSWCELKDEFKREYLTAHHTDDLFDELRKRTQHSSESIGVYLAVMSSYFSRLGCFVPENAKMSIIIKNLHPFYQDRLRDPLPSTVEELRQVCRRMEDRRDAINSYVEPNSRRGNVLERDLAFVDVDTRQVDRLDVDRLEVDSMSIGKESSVVCYRCKKPGHRAIGCLLPKQLKCFKCQREGYTVRTCPRCNQGNEVRRS